MKRNLRILGIDDSPFLRGDRSCYLIGVVMRLDLYIEGMIMSEITVDGTDASDRMVELASSDLGRSCNVILTQGVTFGGFNMIDPDFVYASSGKPVLTVTDRNPDLLTMKTAIRKHLRNEALVNLLDKLVPEQITLPDGSVYYVNRSGISREETKGLLRKTLIRSKVPEPVRIAHLIGRLLKTGKSS